MISITTPIKQPFSRWLLTIVTLITLSGCFHSASQVPLIDSFSPEQLNSFIQTQQQRIADDPENVEGHYFLASAYLKKGLYFQAEKHAQRATQLAPLVGKYFELAGDIAVALEQYGIALNAYKSTLRVDSELVSAYLKLALTYESIEDNERAISTLEESLQIDPRYLPALYHLARLNLKQRQYETALQVVRDALILEPNNPELRLLEVQAHSLYGNYFHARVLVEKLLSSENPPLQARTELLKILFFQKKWDLALEHLDALKTLRHLTPEEQLLHSQILLEQNQVDAAQKVLRNILETSPLHWQTMIHLAKLAIQQGRWEDALTWLGQVIEINNRSAQAYFLQSTIFFRRDNPLQGDLSLNQALTLDPTNLQYQLLSLRRALVKGDTTIDQPLNDLNKEYPLHPEVLRLQADLAMFQGKYAQAETLLRQIQVIQDSHVLQFSLARVLYFQEKYRATLSITKKLVQQPLAPWEVFYLNAAALNRLGLAEEAYTQIQQQLATGQGKGFLHRLAGDLLRYQNKEKEAQKLYLDAIERFPRQIYLVEALSASYLSQSRWKEARDLIENALEETTPLDAILLDRLVLIHSQLKDRQKKRYFLRQYHRSSDPIFVEQSMGIEKRILFRASSVFLSKESDDPLLLD